MLEKSEVLSQEQFRLSQQQGLDYCLSLCENMGVCRSACSYKDFLSSAASWSSRMPQNLMKETRLKWHMKRLDNVNILRCFLWDIFSWWNICIHKWEMSLRCSHCKLWTQSGHEIGLHMCRVYDFHNMLWIFYGLKCLWTIQMVREFCALKKLALVPTIIMQTSEI